MSESTRCDRLIIAGLVALFGGLASRPALPQTAEKTPAALGGPTLPPTDPAELYRLVKRFDFDERKLGNYEDAPMHWVQERGPGLPALYAKGRFDEEVGHAAPPSFRFDIATGNVLYEYRHLDLTVVPESDYTVVGFVRPAKLKHAAAFAAAYFVDRFGERIANSLRVSPLVRATGRDPEPWQRVEIELPGEFPSAHALRLQLWVLQDYVWRVPDPQEIDPIIRRDVYATAWFDDFGVYRLPRVTLRLSNPAGLIRPGAQEAFILNVNNATSRPLRAELCITDVGGRTYHTQGLDVPAMTSPFGFSPAEPQSSPAAGDAGPALATDQRGHMAAIRAPVPELAPGFYLAHLRLLGGSETLLERSTRFAVLPELPAASPRQVDLGVDLGRWRGGDISGVRELLAGLGCAAVKIGIPMAGTIDGEQASSYFQHLSKLVRVMGENRIDATGVILPPYTADTSEPIDSTSQFVARNSGWRDLFSPVLAHFGAQLPTWQLGAEHVELRDGHLWRPEDVEAVRRLMGRFMTIPKLAVPWPVTAVAPGSSELVSVWVPANQPTRALPHQLAFLVDDEASTYWLQLETEARGSVLSGGREIELARRLTLAKALGSERVYLPAPFQLSSRGGEPIWQPTQDFLVVRTLFHYLAGKSAVAAMAPAPDSVAIIFADADSSCLIVWTWREEPLDKPVELYLGPSPRAMTLWGQPVPLEVRDGRTRLPIGPTPLIVEALHTQLASLQASFEIAPTYVQPHQQEPRPILTFRNPSDMPLSGEVRLTPPANWAIDPAHQTFQLEPGETFSQPLTLRLPPKQLAATHDLLVELTLHSPTSAKLHFRQPLTVGLRDIALETTAYWEGDDLVVEHSLRNLSDGPVSFSAFCDAPGHPRQQREFLDVAPGELALQTYFFPNARDELAGAALHIGIEETNGVRSLNQFAEVPQ